MVACDRLDTGQIWWTGIDWDLTFCVEINSVSLQQTRLAKIWSLREKKNCWLPSVFDFFPFSYFKQIKLILICSINTAVCKHIFKSKTMTIFHQSLHIFDTKIWTQSAEHFCILSSWVISVHRGPYPMIHWEGPTRNDPSGIGPNLFFQEGPTNILVSGFNPNHWITM